MGTNVYREEHEEHEGRLGPTSLKLGASATKAADDGSLMDV
jgi:hypothetical protein